MIKKQLLQGAQEVYELLNRRLHKDLDNEM